MNRAYYSFKDPVNKKYADENGGSRFVESLIEKHRLSKDGLITREETKQLIKEMLNEGLKNRSLAPVDSAKTIDVKSKIMDDERSSILAEIE